MQLRVNGTVAAQWEVASSTWATYSTTLSNPVGPTDTVDVVYTNDTAGTGATDRNLYVDSVSVGGQVIQSASRAVSYDRGDPATGQASDGQDVLATDGAVFWGGSLRLTQRYGYDVLGNLTAKDGARVVRTANGQTTLSIAGFWEATPANNGWKASYTLNNQVVAVRDQTNTVTTLHNDHLGSVSLATTSTGALANQQEYDPWGKLRRTVAGRTPSGGLPIPQTTRNFTGQQLDSTGLLFSNARSYDSNAWGATGGGPANPQELNRYSYGVNNPLR